MSDEDDIAALVEGLPRSEHPEWLEPMLAVLTDERFSDPEWIFARKLDGERVLVYRDGNRTRLVTRNQNTVNATYPGLMEAMADQPAREFVADGEVVAFDGKVGTGFDEAFLKDFRETLDARRPGGRNRFHQVDERGQAAPSPVPGAPA
jgi:ATP-dependent DNA ligase